MKHDNPGSSLKKSDFGPRCVALGKSLTFPEPQLPPLKSGENISLAQL